MMEIYSARPLKSPGRVKWAEHKIPETGRLKWAGDLSGRKVGFKIYKHLAKIIENHCVFLKFSRLRRFFLPTWTT